MRFALGALVVVAALFVAVLNGVGRNDAATIRVPEEISVRNAVTSRASSPPSRSASPSPSPGVDEIEHEVEELDDHGRGRGRGRGRGGDDDSDRSGSNSGSG